jgi:hypothetical protein
MNWKVTGIHSKSAEAIRPSKLTEREDLIWILRKAKIAKKLSAAEKLLDDLIANQEPAETQFDKIAEKALEQTKKLTGEKALIIRPVQTEFEV